MLHIFLFDTFVATLCAIYVRGIIAGLCEQTILTYFRA